MSYLIDTHVLLWSIMAPENLSSQVRRIIENPENVIYVSTVSVWEIAIKSSIGKLSFYNFDPTKLSEYCETLNYIPIPITFSDPIDIISLPVKENHKDPFDRLLISQAIKNSFVLLSKDSKFEQYIENGLQLIW